MGRRVSFDWLKRELLILIKKELGTRTASRLSLVGRLVRFDCLKRESLISIKKEPGTRIASRLSLVGRVVSFDWLKRELLISIKKSLERELRPDSVWWRRWWDSNPRAHLWTKRFRVVLVTTTSIHLQIEKTDHVMPPLSMKLYQYNRFCTTLQVPARKR